MRTLMSCTLQYGDLEVTQSENLGRKPDWTNLTFGQNFAGHMLKVSWTETKGWGAPRIGPMQNIKLHPAAKVLHYAIEVKNKVTVSSLRSWANQTYNIVIISGSGFHCY